MKKIILILLTLCFSETLLAGSFCLDIAESIGAVERIMGFDPAQSSFHRVSTATAIVNGMKSGTTKEYIPIQYLVPQTMKQGYVPLTRLVALTLRIKEPLFLLSSTEELKNLPVNQQAIHVVLMTNSAHPLDENKLRSVIFTALRMKIRISVINLAEADSKDAMMLATLALSTNGNFVDLKNVKNACESKI